MRTATPNSAVPGWVAYLDNDDFDEYPVMTPEFERWLNTEGLAAIERHEANPGNTVSMEEAFAFLDSVIERNADAQL